MTRAEFAQAIKMHRDRLNLTQAEAARLLEVSPRVLWDWEKASGNPLKVTMEGVLARLKYARPKRAPAS